MTDHDESLMVANRLSQMADPFADLCILASKQQWCWRINCGTCGHGVFRWGLIALARGKRPGASNWNVSWGSEVTFTALEALNGPMPPFSHWLLDEQRSLQDLVATTDVLRIASECKFPDWLGYLGLALHYTEDAEAESGRLTHALGSQLSKLVDARSSATELLAELATPGTDRRLTWSSLETIEGGILRRSRTRGE